MARRSKLDPVKDQILEWVRQGKDSRTIAELLKERGIQVSHQMVGIYVKKAMAPTLAKVAEKATTKLVSIEELPDKLLSILQDIEATPAENWTPGLTFKLKTFGEYFDRIARLHGLYPKEGLQLGVQVNIDKSQWIGDFIRSIPDDDLRQRLLALL